MATARPPDRARALLAALSVLAAAPVLAQAPDLGFPHHPPELRERLAAALAARAPGLEPRTGHLGPDGRPRFTNRLLLESSPYLLQHAHNPVDWHPWGPEALQTAAREDQPIFLSIGYSTCHWCHVMERESFDDLAIAALLAESFVAIKVDREQRPDLDEVYMTAIQLSGRAGGWPLSAFLTPQGNPFFVATYMPPDRFADVLRAVARMWRADRAEIEVTASSLADAVREVAAARAEAVAVGPDAGERAIQAIAASEDAANGGFRSAPKFPHEPELLFLLDQAVRGASGRAGGIAERALDAMARGGIFDQVGGGFHRYATDARFRVPHFEKMLYNQAQLARAYVAGFRLTGRGFFARTARATLDYVLRDLTSPAGAFYSATDADSEGEEGRFFVWTPAELELALGAEDAAWAAQVLGVSAEGNFEHGRSVLHLPQPLDEVARARGEPLDRLLERLDSVRRRLHVARERREQPLRDEKILTSWNGMVITALAEAHAAFGEERYLAAAVRAGELLWRHARRGEGRLWRVRLGEASSVEALLEDHAFAAEAMLTLHDATRERVWLERGLEVLDGMVEQFWDADGGGFFLSAPGGDEALIARPKSPQDGALPSANAAALRALAMAHHRTGEPAYRERAEALVVAFSGLLERSPASFPYLLLGRTELEAGDTGLRRYGARGRVALAARVAGGRTEPRQRPATGAAAFGAARSGAGPDPEPLRLEIEVEVAPGWHVNAAESQLDAAGSRLGAAATREAELVATRVELAPAAAAAGYHLSAVRYPEPEEVRLGFQESPLSVYAGRFTVRAQLHPPLEAPGADAPGAAIPITLRLQACDDRMCLRPEEVTLRLAVAPLLRPADAPY